MNAAAENELRAAELSIRTAKPFPIHDINHAILRTDRAKQQVSQAREAVQKADAIFKEKAQEYAIAAQALNQYTALLEERNERIRREEEIRQEAVRDAQKEHADEMKRMRQQMDQMQKEMDALKKNQEEPKEKNRGEGRHIV